MNSMISIKFLVQQTPISILTAPLNPDHNRLPFSRLMRFSAMSGLGNLPSVFNCAELFYPLKKIGS